MSARSFRHYFSRLANTSSSSKVWQNCLEASRETLWFFALSELSCLFTLKIILIEIFIVWILKIINTNRFLKFFHRHFFLADVLLKHIFQYACSTEILSLWSVFSWDFVSWLVFNRFQFCSNFVFASAPLSSFFYIYFSADQALFEI